MVLLDPRPIAATIASMQIALSFSCLVVLLILCGAEALAQTPHGGISAADRSAIASCVRESGDSPRRCIGAIAVVCSRQGGTAREDAEVGCSRREAAVWRERLELALAGLAQRLDSGGRSRLASLQRIWESYVAQKCFSPRLGRA